MTADSRVRLWWAIGAIAFSIRLGATLATGGLRHPELNEYDSLARAMLAGQGFVYGHIDVLYYSYAPPLYSWLCAAGYWLTGSIIPTMVLQIVAGSLVAVVAAAIAERIFGGWMAALAAGVLVGLHPGLVVYSATKAHPLAFDALFFALALLQTFRLAERATMRRALELGAIVGVGALSRGTIVIFLPIGALWLLAVTERHERPAVFRNVAVAGACAVVLIAPWSLRNSLRHHQFVWLLTTDSEDFWRGNNPYATGHSYIDANRIVLDALAPDERADLIGQPDELAQARWFMEQANAFIRANPAAFVRLTMLKFFHFWWFAPQSGVRYPRIWLHLYEVYYTGVLLLAAVGVVRITRLSRLAKAQALLVGVFLLALSALQSLYYVEGRHRWAVEPMLLAMSGGGAAALCARRRFHPAEARRGERGE